jgi:hypothetical protein
MNSKRIFKDTCTIRTIRISITSLVILWKTKGWPSFSQVIMWHVMAGVGPPNRYMTCVHTQHGSSLPAVLHPIHTGRATFHRVCLLYDWVRPCLDQAAVSISVKRPSMAVGPRDIRLFGLPRPFTPEPPYNHWEEVISNSPLQHCLPTYFDLCLPGSLLPPNSPSPTLILLPFNDEFQVHYLTTHIHLF